MNIATLREEFCDDAAYFRGYSPETIRRYRNTIRRLERWSGLEQITQYTPELVRAFFFEGRSLRQLSARSFITYHKTLLVFFRWCIAQNHLASNPAAGIEVPRVPKSLPARLSRPQAQRLLDVTENYPWPTRFLRYRNYAIMATFLFTGLRKSELLKLQMVDIELETRSLMVRRGKGGKDRVVPISPTLLGALERYFQERRGAGKTCPEVFASSILNEGLTSEGLKRVVGALSRAMATPLHLHMLRHTFATLMLEGGCDIFSLSRMMGHSDIKTTTIYLAASARHLRAQMWKHPLNSIGVSRPLESL